MPRTASQTMRRRSEATSRGDSEMMNGPNENDKSNPLRELEWLAHFFLQRGHDDTAREIFDRLQSLNMRSQEMHKEDPSNGMDMGQRNQ